MAVLTHGLKKSIKTVGGLSPAFNHAVNSKPSIAVSHL
ncbi:hypothetical protein Nizo2802_1325 [Lactiplantibacillus plantarum]|nr:hypothetical protein Nizo2802_1325 [Lactiplantibacillus plantarum]